MYENAEYIRDLIVKHIQDEITPEEKDQLQQWINASGSNRQLFDELTALPSLYEKLIACDRYMAEKEIVWEKIEKKPRSRFAFLKSPGWIKYAAAAVVLLIAGYWLLTPRTIKPVKPEVIQQQIQKDDIEPGQYKALLTLDNGQTIVLDSAVQGQLTKQGNTVVLNKDGQLVYDASKATRNEVAYNTLTTAKGQTYATVLADGSKVWLNAGSSIRYPVVFTGKERVVEIKGEAYFEVARQATGGKGKVPFIVKIRSATNEDRGQVLVLGTHFNINAYDDEQAIKATLLEGSVKAFNSGGAVLLKPGEQAELSPNAKPTTRNDVNIDAVMAWKEGRFYFDGADITEVMRQLERWYNIEVAYEGAKPAQRFGGKLERSLKLSQVLRALEYTGVKFKLDGRKLIVTP